MFPVLTLLSVSLVAFAPAHAATYRWVDQNGKVQYSDVMPPSQAGEGHSELDKQGRVVKEIKRARVIAEERKRQAEAAARLETEKRRQLELRRRDKALLATYADEKEIELARGRAIEQESLNIRGLQARMDAAAAKLAYANSNLARFRNAGKPAPVGYAQMRDEAQRELALISESMRQRTQAIEDIHTRFAEDAKRYIELKAATPRQ